MLTTKDKILLVDDEPNVLAGYYRGLRQRFDTFTAESGEKGLEILEKKGPFSVVVADMQMPIMDGVDFLKKVRRLAPDTTRMMLTGHADQTTAMNAVNQGNIFRFLVKPCPFSELTAALALGVRQYKLITTEKEVMEKTLSGSIKVLTDILSLSEPEMITRTEKIREYIIKISAKLEIDPPWELEMAAMLAPLGVLTQPPELRTKLASKAELNEKEIEAVDDIPGISAKLIANIPRLEKVAEIIEHSAVTLTSQHEPKILLENQKLEVKIMRIITEVVDREAMGYPLEKVFGYIHGRPLFFDVELAEKIEKLLKEGSSLDELKNYDVIEVRAKYLLIGDILAQNVESLDDRLLLSKGTVLTTVYLARLNNYRRLVGIQEPLKVYRKKIPGFDG